MEDYRTLYELVIDDAWADSVIVGTSNCWDMPMLKRFWFRWEQEIMAHERVDEIKRAFTRRREELER